LLLVISNSGHYIWYIYLNFAVTQTDDCELGLILLMCWRWRGILSSVSLVSRSEINNCRTVLFFTG